MDSKLRKFVIGFISLAAVSAIFVFYGRVSRTPTIDADAGAEFFDTVADSNVGGFDSKVGMLGDIGVGTIRKAKYTTLNKDSKEVEREWGFERLLYEERDVWEIEEPYMNIYRRNFKCYITADTGNVRFETAVSKSTPKDATFTGNVVVHILPEGSSNVKESYIYLDDIIFLSEKSQLSTSGPVKFVSADARMLGTGLELVYDGELERLEYLRIIDLESLRIKGSQAGFLPDAKGQAESQQPSEPAVASDKGETQTAVARPEAGQRKAFPQRSRRGEYYKCIFSKNVLIDSPEQLVFADEKICINDIFWSKASRTRDEGRATKDEGRRKTEDREQSPERKRGDKPRATNHEPRATRESELVDIVVTCDNGFVVVPKDSPRALENPVHGLTLTKRLTRTNTDVSVRQYPSVFDQAEGRTTFIARRVDYNAATGDMVAVGESELEFYTSDAIQTDPNQPAIPVKVTSQKQVRFLQALNQAIFEGDCLCTILREDPNVQQKYTLSAPKLTIDLPRDTNDRSSTSSAGIEHLTADGGLAILRSIKTAGRELLGGIELESRKFDYDPGRGLFIADGPGIIRVNNSRIAESETQTGKFSLRKPCYAFLQNFDTLKYFLQENRIVADADSQRLLISYYPVASGKYGQEVVVWAGHIEALLTETAEGQTEFSTLNASGGIDYEDGDNQFAGSELFYDHEKSIITVRGNRSQPCYLNGALVDGIEYDLMTRKVKASIAGPGALQLNR